MLEPLGRFRARSSGSWGAELALPLAHFWVRLAGLGRGPLVELAGIKGRKAGLRPRPLRQESVAPGDRIFRHIPGAPGLAGEGGAELE